MLAPRFHQKLADGSGHATHTDCSARARPVHSGMSESKFDPGRGVLPSGRAKHKAHK